MKIRKHFPEQIDNVIFQLASTPEAMSRVFQKLSKLDWEENRKNKLLVNRNNADSANSNADNNSAPPLNQQTKFNNNRFTKPNSFNPVNSRGVFLSNLGEDFDDVEEVEIEENPDNTPNYNINSIITQGDELLEEEKPQAALGSSPRIKGHVADHELNILLDGGSEVSLLGVNVYEKLKKKNLIQELKGGSFRMSGPFLNSKQSKPVSQIVLKVTYKSQHLVCFYRC